MRKMIYHAIEGRSFPNRVQLRNEFSSSFEKKATNFS